MRRPDRQNGFSIVEVLVALTITVIVLTSLSTMLISSIRTDGASRARTTVNSVVESWLDRYRARQEPLNAVGNVCTATLTTFSCTYPKGHDYAADGWYPHSASAGSMNERFQPYQSVITGTRLQAGTNRALWQINVQVRDEARQQTVEAATYVLQ
ncbi:type IV pilus modification PilV family protein [Deinococcus navajonensis]|uniref:Prepilin-type N-terminal cleavage/methylation domain-containing protein n=1 Tax=Deinococcus navajonensis TaxID=309884 RepID=A0ABV8XP43_9DEIO